MKIQPLLAIGVLLLAADASRAADPAVGASPLTRQQAKQSVLKARAAGDLRVGDDPDYPDRGPTTTPRTKKQTSRDSARASEPKSDRRSGTP